MHHNTLKAPLTSHSLSSNPVLLFLFPLFTLRSLELRAGCRLQIQYNPNGRIFLLQPFQTRSSAFVAPMFSDLQSLSAYMRSKDFVDAVARSRTATNMNYSAALCDETGDEGQFGSGASTPTNGTTDQGATEMAADNSDDTDVEEDGGENDSAQDKSHSSRRRPHREKSLHVSDGVVTGTPRFPCFSDAAVILEPDATKYRVRGPNYLDDGVKQAAAPAMFRLVACDLFSFENPAERRNIGDRSAICKRADEEGLSPGQRAARHTFIVNIIPPSSKNLAVVLYFQPLVETWRDTDPRFTRLYDAFCNGDDDYRNRRFKIIPDLIEGSWMMRSTLRSRPALPGTKSVDLVYHKGDNWFEVDLDVSGRSQAKIITGLAMPLTKSLVVDIAFLVESQEADELPEQIIGAARFSHVDLGKSHRVKKNGDIGEGLPPQDEPEPVGNKPADADAAEGAEGPEGAEDTQETSGKASPPSSAPTEADSEQTPENGSPSMSATGDTLTAPKAEREAEANSPTSAGKSGSHSLGRGVVRRLVGKGKKDKDKDKA